MNENENPFSEVAPHALYAALAQAQGEFAPIEKNRKVVIRSDKGNYEFRYADLEEILAKTRPALTKNGLALFQVLTARGTDSFLRCELAHKDGGRVVSEITLPARIGDPKQFGAQLTYFRRYMITSILGVAADDDLDDDGQETKQAPAKAPVSTPQSKSKPQASAPSAGATAEGDTNKLATPGERTHIIKKFEAAGLELQDALDQLGIPDFEKLTVGQFTQLRSYLAGK